MSLTLKPRYLSFLAIYTLQVQKGEVTAPVCFLPSFLLRWALRVRDTLSFRETTSGTKRVSVSGLDKHLWKSEHNYRARKASGGRPEALDKSCDHLLWSNMHLSQERTLRILKERIQPHPKEHTQW